MADGLYSPRDYFLGNLSTWDYDVPYTTQWVVRIIPRARLSDFLAKIGSTIEADYSGFVSDPVIQQILFSENVHQILPGLGMHFAQKVTLPKESFSPTSPDASEQGGFMSGVIGGDRVGIRDKSITTDLLETNTDFIDGIIRPWIITTAYTGLIERTDTVSIKADIQVVQYTKGSDRPARKIHEFLGCVPFDVDQSSLDYDTERAVNKTVGWVYNTYTYKLRREAEDSF